MQGRKQRADSLVNQKGWHCCQFAAYVIYGDKSQNHGGAAGWHKQGQVVNDVNSADVITNGSHVGVIIRVGQEVYVYHAPGANSQNPIKAYTYANFVNYVMKNGTLRRL
ncbi:unnamed protein product [Paramecium primaurelia]|uniref:Uncharacterized protein n=1 Tax=Paramecium primaurelia TaxID=5886 RepID=A0A8S1MDY6_PARPR|nr:unnamed protein product [Paramecium primaurelia]